MQVIASQLTEDDVSSVSAWLASLPGADNPSPLPAGTLDTP
jgi:cytochrome c553